MAGVVVVDSLENCKAEMVFAAGRRVTDALFATRKPIAPVGLDSVKARLVKAADFGVPVAEGDLRERLAQLSGWSIGRTQRVASGFYTSQALELVRHG